MFTVQHLPGATQYQPSKLLTATERSGWRYSKPSSLRLRHHTQQSSKRRFLCLQNKSCIWPLLPIALSPTSSKRHPPKSQSLRSQVTAPSPFLWFPHINLRMEPKVNTPALTIFPQPPTALPHSVPASTTGFCTNKPCLSPPWAYQEAGFLQPFPRGSVSAGSLTLQFREF